MPRITGAMRGRLRSLTGALGRFIRHPDPFDDAYGCLAAAAMLVLAAVVIMAGLYLAGVIDYDFTRTPEERAAEGGSPSGAAADVADQEPGPPYLEGRHFAIIGSGSGGDYRAYTFELVGEGESGSIRVWEDDTGRGSFQIVDGNIHIEMERMVPPERREIFEPNVFDGVMAPDGSGFSGTWTREGWTGVPGAMELTGEWSTVPFRGERL